MLLKKEKETRVKFNPGFRANRPSNNWAQNYIVIIYTGLKAKPLLNRGKGWGNFIRCLEEMVIWRVSLKINRWNHLKSFVHQVVHVALVWDQAP